MSAYPPSDLIACLNHDTLLHIFELNADMFSDKDALHTTHIASQVCYQWRSVMLSRPFLWAKLIDMDAIDSRYSREWGDELIQRSGAAPLWIKASGLRTKHRGDATRQIVQFFSDVINMNWGRIQKLVVHDSIHSRFTLDRSMPLCLPAPQLEIFEATFRQENGADRDETPMGPLFEDNAPMLRNFRLIRYVVNQPTTWMRCLQSMELDAGYSVRDVFVLLSATKNLQELKLNNIDTADLSAPPHIVPLPRLKHLHYNGHPQPGATILDHIELPLGCSLSVQISDCRTKKEQLISMVDTFSRYAQRYLQLQTFSIVHVNYTEGSISFKGEMSFPTDCLFSISIPVSSHLYSGRLEMFCNTMALLDLSSITKLQFNSTHPLLNPCFQSLFTRFAFLDIICIDRRTLGCLKILQNGMGASMFPFLKTVNFYRSTYRLGGAISAVAKEAEEFVMWRLKNGHPITTLDMSNNSPFVSPPDLGALADVEGLKVLYKCSSMTGIFEYTCGSGDLEGHPVTL